MHQILIDKTAQQIKYWIGPDIDYSKWSSEIYRVVGDLFIIYNIIFLYFFLYYDFLCIFFYGQVVTPHSDVGFDIDIDIFMYNSAF